MTPTLRLTPPQRIYAGFFIYSFCAGSIPPRIPDLQRAMGVGEGALGFGLTGVAAGMLVSLSFAGPLMERMNHRRVLLLFIPLLALFYAGAGFAGSPPALFALMLPAGLVMGGIEIVMNLEADRTEQLVGRRIMNRSHAFWSFGYFAAGLTSAAIAETGLALSVHLLLMVPLVLIGTLLVFGGFEPAPHRTGTSKDAAPRFAAPTRPILVLVAVSLSAMLLEGAGNNWSALYMLREFSVSPFLAGFAVALGALTQAVARFFGDSIVEQFRPVSVARAFLAVVAVGALLVVFAGHPWQALIGFGMMGAGTSVIFPLAMSAAARLTDRPAATNVASLALIAFGTFLLGPPLLGSVAEAFGLRWPFAIAIPLIAVSLILAPALEPRRGVDGGLPHAA